MKHIKKFNEEFELGKTIKNIVNPFRWKSYEVSDGKVKIGDEAFYIGSDDSVKVKIVDALPDLKTVETQMKEYIKDEDEFEDLSLDMDGHLRNYRADHMKPWFRIKFMDQKEAEKDYIPAYQLATKPDTTLDKDEDENEDEEEDF